jgi:hypothetical protein
MLGLLKVAEMAGIAMPDTPIIATIIGMADPQFAIVYRHIFQLPIYCILQPMSRKDWTTIRISRKSQTLILIMHGHSFNMGLKG